MEKIPYELLIKFCRKETTSEENSKVEKWLSDKDNLSTFLDLKEEWRFINEPSFVAPDKEILWEKIKRRTNFQVKQRFRIGGTLKTAIAACLLVAITLSVFHLLIKKPSVSNSAEQYTTISTLLNEKLKVELNDGTSVWLNSSSSLTFGDDYNTDLREVVAKGELYFEVVPSDKKFILTAGEIKIEVLGTSFNVNISDSNNIKIALKEGRIAVLSAENDTKLFELSPSQYAVVDKKTLLYEVQYFNVFSYNTWTFENLLIYDEPLNEIFEKLEKRYNIQIEQSGLDTHKHYTFNIQEETITELLDIFSIITPIDYQILENKVYIKPKGSVD